MIDRRGATNPDEAAHKRRHTIRHNCTVGIEMLIGHASGYSDVWSVDSFKIKGRMLDLSTGGASLFTRQKFDTGQELRLAIQLRDGSQINTKGTVRWVKEIPQKDGHASGIQFVHVTESDQKKISKFLDEIDASAGL